MSEALSFMEQVINGRSGFGGFDWDHILAALHELEGDRTPDAEAIMVDLAGFEGPLELAGRSANLPHALSPVDLLRSHAVQTLARWDPDAHRDVIQHVAETAEAAQLRAIAASCL